MTKSANQYPAVIQSFPHMIHGADYNPDQWLDRPDILEEDMRLMKKAGVNEVSIGIFAWKALEPEEGKYTFEWLDELMDRLEENNICAFLATPSGARPAWMDKNHPEVLRTEANRVKNLHGQRHNHCFTSPYYRKKVREMNTMLAERYKGRKALKLWHVSNEYGGACHCELCQKAFRDFLREKYGNDIKKLNDEWWTRFWSHEYSDFSEIESPAMHGETSIHGLCLDWNRFVTYQTRSFMENEIAPLKEITPEIPVTTNFMGTFPGLDYWELSKCMDVISWDSYPSWHNDWEKVEDTAWRTAFIHDINRSILKKPFLLMESTPSQVNWQPVNKLKRPGMQILAGLQAVAHGSDSVQYFQWRKGRGSSEKFHGAVVDHYGKEDTRVFQETAQLGEILKRMDAVAGTMVYPEVTVLYDWENRWAIDSLQGLNNHRDYEDTCMKHYQPFWKKGIPVDVNCMTQDFLPYKLVVAPMLYMLKPGVATALKSYVQQGGTLVLTYCSGYVNENDLCFLGGFPGDGLMEVAGIWAEEMDPLYPTDENLIEMQKGKQLDSGKTAYRCHTLCELIHAKEDTEVLAVYGKDFYKGRPVVTKNRYGQGSCYYIAARTDSDFLEDFYSTLIQELDLKRPCFTEIPEGVSVQIRCAAEKEYIFVMNFTEETKSIESTQKIVNVITGQMCEKKQQIPPYGYLILEAAAKNV